MDRNSRPWFRIAPSAALLLVGSVVLGVGACELALGIEPGSLGDPNEGDGGAAGAAGAGGQGGAPIPESCRNEERDPGETDIDCGGSLCPGCENGQNCLWGTDCQSGYCLTDLATPVCMPCGDHGDCEDLPDAYCDPATEECTPTRDNGADCSYPFECESGNCVDGVCCDAPCNGGCDQCNSPEQLGTCVTFADGSDGDGTCAPYLCDGASAACPTSCAGPTDCAATAYCNESSQCQGTKSNGEPCVNGTECASENCVDTVCCAESDCPGACTVCNAPGSEGSCATAPVGFACDDGLYCNGTDYCMGDASCTGHQNTPCPGPDGDSDCSESCNEGADDCSALDGQGAACSDDLYCNGADSCDAGGDCAVHVGDPCAAGYSDSNCTGGCNESLNSCYAGSPEPQGSPCDDGTYCNGADTCNASGSCTSHAGNPCSATYGDADCMGGCYEAGENCSDEEPSGSACDDGTYCNGPDTCNSSGSCINHQGNPCPGADGDSDCNESCDETNDNCSLYDGNSAACSDSLYCNGSDLCNAGTCSIHGTNPCPGPDGDTNCFESCDESNDNCTLYDGEGAACGSGDQCTGGTCS